MTPNDKPAFTPAHVCLLLGAVSLALILGALGFQYLGGLPPCEMCLWQRWPHVGAIMIGIGGGLLARAGVVTPRAAMILGWCAVLLLAVTGALGVFHAGVEWHFWRGPEACTGNAFHYGGGKLDLNAPVVMCDVAAWRLFGISMAGYNAIISLGAAMFGAWALARIGKNL